MTEFVDIDFAEEDDFDFAPVFAYSVEHMAGYCAGIDGWLLRDNPFAFGMPDADKAKGREWHFGFKRSEQEVRDGLHG